MSNKEPTDFPQEERGEKIERLTSISNGITVLTLNGKVNTRRELLNAYADVLREFGILKEPEKYLIRNVRKNLLEILLQNGCERNEKSYRDRAIEADFNLSPEDYTYCNRFNGDEKEYLRHATYNPDGTVTVFYKADEMVPHHEEKYDKASSLGLGPTKVTYSFRNLEHKTKAIALVIQSRLQGVGDLWQVDS